MAKISNILNVSVHQNRSGNLTIPLLISLAICVIGRPAEAETSVFVFGPDQSTVFRSGGIAGLQKTLSIAGQFRLTVDLDTSIASFQKVDANLTDESGSVYGQNLDEIFNMTGLAGTIIDNSTIEFEGKTADGTESDVSLKLILSDDSAHLTGQTTPPPNSADMFFYDIDAVATKKYAGGTGEPNDPYQIATAADLIALGEMPEDYDKHFILTADIDLDPNLPGRKVFDKAVIAPDTDPNDTLGDFQGTHFTGIFDGSGHRISHLRIMGADYLGLFGQLAPTASIKNLGAVDVNIVGSGHYVGGLVGFQYCGTVTRCYSTGIVIGQWAVGGLVGTNCEADVTDCYSTAAVSGKLMVGGLVGYTEGSAYVSPSVTRCYSTGMVSGGNDVGGLVGSGDIGGNAIACFWDTQTSGRAASEGGPGTGKTTAEMQTASTFLEAGWDFVGETENGTQDIWSICEGTNYPRLVWQIPAGDFVCPDGITIDDFLFFMEHWLDDNCDSSNGYCQGTDLDQSGTVDVNDLEIFFENWSAEQ